MLTRNTIFTLFISSLGTLGLLHVLSSIFFLYWSYPWLDIPMHVLGGIVVALGFLSAFPQFIRTRVSIGVITVLGVALSIGIGWEILDELMGGVFALEEAPIVDTITDLVMGVAGAALGYVFVRIGMERE